jgi:hypothetical protein
VSCDSSTGTFAYIEAGSEFLEGWQCVFWNCKGLNFMHPTPEGGVIWLGICEGFALQNTNFSAFQQIHGSAITLTGPDVPFVMKLFHRMFVDSSGTYGTWLSSCDSSFDHCISSTLM